MPSYLIMAADTVTLSHENDFMKILEVVTTLRHVYPASLICQGYRNGLPISRVQRRWQHADLLMWMEVNQSVVHFAAGSA